MRTPGFMGGLGGPEGGDEDSGANGEVGWGNMFSARWTSGIPNVRKKTVQGPGAAGAESRQAGSKGLRSRRAGVGWADPRGMSPHRKPP